MAELDAILKKYTDPNNKQGVHAAGFVAVDKNGMLGLFCHRNHKYHEPTFTKEYDADYP
jgi:hypothetical protein